MMRFFTLIATTVVALGAWQITPVLADELTPAGRIIEAAGIRAGLCVHLNSGDGKLTAGLGLHDAFLVHGLELDEQLVRQARAWIQSQAEYGSVSVTQSDQTDLPYSDNLVNLLVLEDAPRAMGGGLSLREISRVLVPSGVAMLGGWSSAKGELEKTKAELQDFGIRDLQMVDLDRPWLRFAKPRPGEIDEWTHLNHNAGGNRVSQDRLAGPPSSVQWIDGPTWATSAKGPGGAVTSGARLFYLFDEAPHRKPQESWDTLYARDAFNGLLLWKRPAPGFASLCLIATDGRVYTVLEKKGGLVSLDAATGRVVTNYIDASQPEWVVCAGDRLFMSAGGGYTKQLRCLDAATGDVRWQRDVRLRPTGALPNFVVDGEQAFYFDWQNRKLGCLDLTTGKDHWQQDVSATLTGTKWTYGLCSHQTGTLMVGEGTRGKSIHAFSDENGQHLWSHGYQLVLSGRGQRHKGSTYDEGFFVDGLYWTHVGKPRTVGGGGFAWEGLEPSTGQVKKRFEYAADVNIGDACHRAQATVNYFLGGHSRFVDAQTGEFRERAGGIHNSCRYGMLPANGLVTTWSQYTTTYVRGTMGLTSSSTIQDDTESSTRFEKGPGYAAVEAGGPADLPETHDWPCFGHDPMRSGRTNARVPVGDLSLLWDTGVGGKLTAPTIAGQTVYVAQPDRFRVVALRAGDGNILWTRTLGGRISTPPTLHQGLCLIGCGDGWVYCLAASDGKLIWRFRAAPSQRLIVARDRLESPWPVTGGVLIDDDVAYFAAGRHGSLDGGIATYAVEPFTGKVLWSKRVTEAPVLHLPMCDGRSLGLGTKTGLATKTGEPASRVDAPEAAFAADRMDLTHRIGANSEERRIQAQTTVHPAAIVRTADVTFIAGQTGTEPPALSWVEQRNATVVAEMPPPQSAATGEQILCAFSANDGQLVATRKLDTPATFDGMAAAHGYLFLSTIDGRVLCFGQKQR